MVVLRGNDVTLNWTITKCIDGSEVPEDFSGANLTVYLQTLYGKKETEAVVDGNVITIRIAGNKQQSSQVGIEAIWSKNDGRNWSRARENRVVDFTENPALVTRCPGNASVDVHTIEVKSSLFGGVGYDGVDGVTPAIGENGNWWMGERDTGVPATGERGAPFTFEDFTPGQIDALKRPAEEAAKEVVLVEKSISENEAIRIKSEESRMVAELEREKQAATIAPSVKSANEAAAYAKEQGDKLPKFIVLTQAEYDKLPADKLSDGNYYIIL